MAALLALVHALSFLGSGPIDDDYIVYRYAENWVRGLGPVFNAGERVEGFTVPLWVMVHAVGARLGFDAAHFSVVVGVLGSAVTAWALARAWQGLRPEARWPVPALVFALTPAAAWHAVAGLGTTWMTAFVALWSADWVRAEANSRAPRRAGVWIGMGALLRPELLFFALPFVLRCAGRRRLFPVLASLLPVTLWAAFRWTYYEALTPVSLGVKRLDVATDLAYGARYFLNATRSLGLPVLLSWELRPACVPRPRNGVRRLCASSTSPAPP